MNEVQYVHQRLILFLFVQLFDLFFAVDYELPLNERRRLLSQAEPHVTNPISAAPPFYAFLCGSRWPENQESSSSTVDCPSRLMKARLLNPSLFSTHH